MGGIDLLEWCIFMQIGTEHHFYLQILSEISSYPSGILRDKTMDAKLMYIHNKKEQNQNFCGSKLLVENFGQY